MSGDLLARAAATYVERFGWPVFPLTPRGKAPLTPHGYKDATTDLDQIKKWWDAHPEANIGLACDKAGFAIADVDTRGGGHDTLDALEAEHGKLPDTVEALTSDGGRHLYFHVNGAERLPGVLGDGIELKHHGYVILPPSVHPSGHVYTWEVSSRPGEVEVAELPGWVAVFDKMPDGTKKPIPDKLTEGMRHKALLRVAGAMRRQGAGYDEIHAALTTMNETRCNPPKPASDIEELARDVTARYDPEPADVDGAGDGGAEAMDREVEKELVRLRIRHRAEQALRGELAGPPRPLDVATLTERLANPLPPVERRVEGWQAQGTRGILTAAFKAGKTTLIGNLMRSLTDGGPFLEVAEAAPLPGALGLLDFEMSARMLNRWLADQKIGDTDRVILLPLRGNAAAFNIVNPDVRSEWAQRLRHYGIVYLIADPLRPVLDALGLNEHTEAGIFLQAFDQLLTEADIPEALIAHHHGHGAERARGDSRLRDWPDFEWKLVRQDADDPASPRYISAYGRDIEVAESLLRYDEETRRLTLTGGSRRHAELRGALTEIEKLLGDPDTPSAPMTQNAVERALEDSDYSRGMIRKALTHGVKEGRLDVTPGPNKSKLYTRYAGTPEYATAHRRTDTVSGAPPLSKGAPPHTTDSSETNQTSPAHPEPPCPDCDHHTPGMHFAHCPQLPDPL